MTSLNPARLAGGGVLLLLGALVLWIAATPALAAPEGEKDCPRFPWCRECPESCPCPTCECRPVTEPKCVPKYHNLRFEENWKPCLCVPCCDRPDWTDFLKARPLSRCRSVWADFGGQFRFRYEAWSNQRFRPGAAADDAWGLLRVRAHADIHICKPFRVFVEGIYAEQYVRDGGPRPIDRNRGDLLNFFAEVHGEICSWKALARVGRFELQEGRQRLVSPLDWANTRRTFQGLFGRVQKKHHRIDLWATTPVRILATELDESNDDVGFWGVYYTNRVLTCLTWELYGMGLHREGATYLGVTDDEDRITLGGRAGGDIPSTRLFYDVELAGQFGTFGDADIVAGMASVNLGIAPCWTAWEETIEVGFDYASGDSDEADKLGTFNQLYPLGHAFLGFADLLGRQNVIAGRITGKVKPSKTTTLRLDYHGFWRADENDAVYNVGGGVLRAPAAGVDDLAIGSELDFSFVWKVNRHWRIAGGWAHFFAGEYLEATGDSEDVDFVWAEAQWTF